MNINVNQYQLILQEKQKPTYSIQKKPALKGPINLYEPRFDRVNFSNAKINEVIGWMLIIAVLLLFFTMGLAIAQDLIVGFAIPLLAVVAFFMVYLNWVSMKFFVNS